MENTKASPIHITIYCCQVIDIEIDRCIPWYVAGWFHFREYAEGGHWFVSKTKTHNRGPTIFETWFHCRSELRKQSISISYLHKHKYQPKFIFTKRPCYWQNIKTESTSFYSRHNAFTIELGFQLINIEICTTMDKNN